GMSAERIIGQTPVERRESLVVSLCLCRIGSRYEPLPSSGDVDCIFDNGDFARRTQLFLAGIDDHGAVNSALNVKVGYRTGGSVIHKDAGRIDFLLDGHGFSRRDW